LRLGLLPKHAFDRSLECVGVETEGAPAAVIGDTTVAIDEVEAIWPSGIGHADRIVDVVDERR